MSKLAPLSRYDQIDQIAQGFRAAQLLFTAVRLGVFEALVDQSWRTLGELSRELACDARGLRILCDALVAQGLLLKSSSGYANCEAGRRYLLSQSPESRAASLRHQATLYQRWGHLPDSVRSGKPAAGASSGGRSTQDRLAFAEAMAEIGRSSAAATADKLDLTGVTRLLDIGGGPAVYAIEFARRYPRLQITVLDDAETLRAASQRLAESDVSSRVSLRPGDAFVDDLGTGFEVVFLSNFIHIFGPEQNCSLIRRCAGALGPRGRIIIKDFLLDDDRTSPPGAALFAVNMLLSTEGGDCFACKEVEEWFGLAGIELDQIIDLTPQTRIAIGRKAG